MGQHADGVARAVVLLVLVVRGVGVDRGAPHPGVGVVGANVKEGEHIFPNNHIMLVTDQPEMPDISGWSRREVLQLTDLLELKTETFGHGFVSTQHISEGTPLNRGDYLGVEFNPPNDAEGNETPESEAEMEEDETDNAG